MAKVTPYLNFDGKTEEAFNFYKSVFGGEFISFQYFKDIPSTEGYEYPEEEANNVMHVTLKVNDNFVLMASDISKSAGHQLNIGNNIYISLEPDTQKEAEKFFEQLSKDGEIEMPLEKTFWNAYFASFKDKYGIGWMINYQIQE